jgi:hypothetical protein
MIVRLALASFLLFVPVFGEEKTEEPERTGNEKSKSKLEITTIVTPETCDEKSIVGSSMTV